MARAYERIKANKKAIEAYTKYLELVKDPVDYQMAKSRLDKLENLGAGDAEESVGLLDKIMSLFNKG